MKKEIAIRLTIIACFLALAGITFGQSLAFNQVHVFRDTDGLQTVPVNKVWKIVNVNGGKGTITVTGASTTHCGTTCTGGSCSLSSCKYLGYLWELNGTQVSEVEGCFVCSGGICVGNLPACPPTFNFPVDSLPVVNTPFWLKAGNTLKINASNVLFSIIEFDVTP